jgi:hypothetical protein
MTVATDPRITILEPHNSNGISFVSVSSPPWKLHRWNVNPQAFSLVSITLPGYQKLECATEFQQYIFTSPSRQWQHSRKRLEQLSCVFLTP